MKEHMKCDKPPAGWECTREAGHEGPCAARSVKLIYVERQTFRQEPDCYAGRHCNRHRPRWMTSYPKEGDEEDGEILKLEIDAKMMPPGSRVTIEVPCCPNCGEPADMWHDCLEKVREWPKCRCGFSWKKWVEDNFS